jgi:UDP:flavonoid glycosyltransferase YjiC (YdhE family)
MSRVLLVPFPQPGHTEPMAALAAQLHQDGHQVVVFAESLTTRWGLNQPVPPEMYAAADGGALFRWLFLGDVADMARDIAELAERSAADLIVSDVMMPGGGLAAELTGVPWASLSCSPVPVADAYRTFIPEHAVAAFDPRSTLEALGLPAGDGRNLLGRVSGGLHLIPVTPRLAGFPAVPAQVALVGPFAPLPPRPQPAQVGRPTVVVTASTHSVETLGGRAFVQDRYLAVAVEALGGLDATGLVTHHGVGRPPANVTFVGRVPHDALFDRAAAVVTHAGWGAVSRALVRGLPLVLVPISGDQSYVAARCAELGVGIALASETVTAAELRGAIRTVIEQPRYRAVAAEVAAELRSSDPLATAVSMITSMHVLEG